jgi:hypothetical protein
MKIIDLLAHFVLWACDGDTDSPGYIIVMVAVCMGIPCLLIIIVLCLMGIGLKIAGML